MSDKGPSRLPTSQYSMPKEFAEFIRHQEGIVGGHEAFNNNILGAEAFMKELDMALNGYKFGLFNTLWGKDPPKTKINWTYVNRIKQIWYSGLHLIYFRDPNAPESIWNRVVAYRMQEEKIVVHGREFPNPYEVMKFCEYCNGELVAFMDDPRFGIGETDSHVYCLKCDYRERCNVEIKPPLKELKPQRPIESSPVIREVSARVMVKYALEGVPLIALQSAQAGYYSEINGIKYPEFEDYDEIDNSIDFVQFVGKPYFDSTLDIMFREWFTFFSELFVIVFMLSTEKFKITPKSQTTSAYKDMERA